MKTKEEILEQIDYWRTQMNPYSLVDDDEGGMNNPIEARAEALEWVIGEGRDLLEGYLSTKPKTEEDVRRMVSDLEKHKKEVPRFSSRAEDNWAPIDGQIEVLNWVLGS